MEAGSVKEFINNLTIQDEMVRYDGQLYYFYGIRYDSDRKLANNLVKKLKQALGGK